VNFYTSNELERAKEQTNAQNNWKWRDTHVMSENFGDFEKSPIYPQRHFVRKKMSRKKKVIIVATIIMFLYFVYGLIGGFRPFEQRLIESRVREYVVATHGLTPTEVRVTTLYLWFPVTVRVETKEHNFWFEIRTGRFYYRDRYFSDDFLARKAGYILSRDLRVYVEKRTNSNGRGWVLSDVGGENLQKLLTLSEIEENPGVVFERLKGQHRVVIVLYYDSTKNNHEIDYDLIYDIFYHIFEVGLNPSSMGFSFIDVNAVDLTVSLVTVLRSRYFHEINSPEDLKPFFEEAIQRMRN